MINVSKEDNMRYEVEHDAKFARVTKESGHD